MIIKKLKAAEVLRRAATSKTQSEEWVEKVRELSRLCEQGVSKTHIAFLGTSILAKAVDDSADLIAIKPRLVPNNPRAYSARSLCHGVLVPLSAELGFDIGVSGREPLNNQPYFRMTTLGDDTPVHAGGREAFDYMVGLVRELNNLSSVDAEVALAAFISVRREYLPSYEDFGGTGIEFSKLLYSVKTFVGETSEGGKRAQAIAAGLIDTLAGEGSVLSGRINDPSRKHPGDVCVISSQGQYEKCFEVRDKPVTMSDALIFARKCIASNVRDAAIVAASTNQERLDLDGWAENNRIGIVVFYDWRELAEQCFFWSELPFPEAASRAAEKIHMRLIEVEAAPSSIETWNRLAEVTDLTGGLP